MDRRLAIAALMIFTVFLGFGIIIPVLPMMVADIDRTTAEWHTGLLLSLYSLMSFLFSPFWGSRSERVGRRPVILTGVLGFCVSFVLFGLAEDRLWLMYASRLLGGFFSGAVTASIVAYVADITGERERTRGMAAIGMSIGLGFTFGPFVGGLLSKVSLGTPFFAAAGLSLLTFVLGWMQLKESLPAEQRALQRDKPRASRWAAFRGSLKYLYILAFFVTFSLAILEATLQLYGMDRFAATPLNVGIMFFFCGLIGALVQGGFVRRYVRHGREGWYIGLGLVISAAGFFLLLTADSWTAATVCLCIFGVGNAILRPCVTSLITQKATVGQGLASGLNSSMDSLGRIAGPLLGAALLWLADWLPYAVAGLLSLAALGLLFRFRRLDQAAPHSA